MDRFHSSAKKTSLPLDHSRRWLVIGALFCLFFLMAISTQRGFAQESAPSTRTFSMPSIQRHTVDDPDAFVYTVRLGEYWILIARKFGVSYDELRGANPDLWTQRGELIWPGDEMSIPGLTAADAWETIDYVVEPGDSWYAIAHKFGVTYWDLRLDNLGLWRMRQTVIRPGDVMQIVNPKPSVPVAVEEPGDASATAEESVATEAPEETQPEETQSEETQPEETQPEETQPEETQPEESDSQPAAPDTTAPDTTTPGGLPTTTVGGPAFIVTNPPADALIYSVRTGDSWFGIAARYGFTFENLRTANQELWALRGQNIRPADEMIIPAHGSPPPPMEIRTAPEDGAKDGTDSMTKYTVLAGDTWESVAASVDSTAEALKAANVDVSSRELVPGDVIKIP